MTIKEILLCFKDCCCFCCNGIGEFAITSADIGCVLELSKAANDLDITIIEEFNDEQNPRVFFDLREFFAIPGNEAIHPDFQNLSSISSLVEKDTNSQTNTINYPNPNFMN